MKDFPGLDLSQNKSLWTHNQASPVLPSGGPGSDDGAMASDPKVPSWPAISCPNPNPNLQVFWDEEQQVWVMFYFGVGDATQGQP